MDVCIREPEDTRSVSEEMTELLDWSWASSSWPELLASLSKWTVEEHLGSTASPLGWSLWAAFRFPGRSRQRAWFAGLG